VLGPKKKKKKKKKKKQAVKNNNWLRVLKTIKDLERDDQQPSRILEIVKSDNNKNLSRRSHRRVFFLYQK